jgi:hypothetical protein
MGIEVVRATEVFVGGEGGVQRGHAKEVQGDFGLTDEVTSGGDRHGGISSREGGDEVIATGARLAFSSVSTVVAGGDELRLNIAVVHDFSEVGGHDIIHDFCAMWAQAARKFLIEEVEAGGVGTGVGRGGFASH